MTYRYFASQGALLAAAHPHTAWESALPEDPPRDVEARLDLVLEETAKMLLEFEPQQRTMLRLSRTEAIELMHWSARAMLDAARADAAVTRRDRKVSPKRTRR